MRRVFLAGLLVLTAGVARAQPAPPAHPAPTSPDQPGAGRPAADQPGADPPKPAPTAPAKPTAPPDKLVRPAPAAPAEPQNPAAASDERNTTKPPDERVDSADVVSLGDDRGFRFGSYGRVLGGTDLRGGKPEKLLVVAHGPRIVEDSYLELDSSYGFVTPSGVKLRPVVTLGFDGTLFHETGQFDAHPALRNLFLDAAVSPRLTLWVGSRMYRGDDIYLFDFWPLDNQNTVGAGAFYYQGPVELAVHFGENRLLVPFQYQQLEVPNPAQGATTVTQLNRQRLVASATASYLIDHGPRALNIKLKLHAQVHEIASGEFARGCDANGINCDGTYEHLPADSGVLIGAEISLFGLAAPELGYRRHLNLFARYARGLAAFDELAPPTSFGTDLTTQKANELLFGLSGNWDDRWGNVMVGALSRRFIDASGQSENPNDGWEYAVDARPLLELKPDWFAGADVSYQARFPDGFNPITERAEDPAIFQIAPMVVFSPMGPSGYDRPQLRFVFRAAHLNDGALDEYVPMDVRHGRPWEYYLGAQAEWWFNSSSYR